MNADKFNVLKSFAHKLSNCKYRVKADSLIEFLDQGRYGFSYSKNSDKIEPNEFAFADDVAIVITHIKKIFQSPIITLGEEETVQNVSVASRLNHRLINETLKDEKLWTVGQNGNIIPESTHTTVYEDEYATYENRFICALIDILLVAVNQKLEEMRKKIKTVNGEICGYENGKTINTNLLDIGEYIDFLDKNNGCPFLLPNEAVFANLLDSFLKSKRMLLTLKADKLYASCQRAGKFNLNTLTRTNVFNYNEDYHYCFYFYNNYLKDNYLVSELGDAYRNFIFVHIISALDRLGFKGDSENEIILVNRTGNLNFKKLVYNKPPFSVEIVNNELNLDFTITETFSLNTAKYSISTIYSEDAEKINNFDINAYYSDYVENSEGYIEKLLFSDLSGSGIKTIIPNSPDSVEKFINILKPMFFIAKGSTVIHSRYCPVCGSMLVSKNENDYVCSECNTIYSFFNCENMDIIWLKYIPNKSEAQSTVDQQVSEKQFIDDDDIDFGSRGKSLKFIEKLPLISEESQNYYQEIKDYALSFKKVNSRVCAKYDKFTLKKVIKILLGIRGKTLVMYTPLDYNEYKDSKYFPHDKSDLKYLQGATTMFKIKSARGVKQAKELIDIIMGDTERYAISETKEVLPKEIKEAEMVNETEEVAVTDDAIDFGSRGKSLKFIEKLPLISEESQNYYQEIKDYALSFKKVNSRVCAKYDKFTLKKVIKILLGIRGKTLVMYTPLDYNEYKDSKYFPHDKSDLKYLQGATTMFKIKSARGVKQAKELIDIIMGDTERYAISETKEVLPKEIKETEMVNETEEVAVTDDAIDFGSRGKSLKFIEKLPLISEESQNYYQEIKDYALSFKKVNSRVCAKYDKFTLKKVIKILLGIRGKTLVMYTPLDYNEYKDSKYFPHDKSDLKYLQGATTMFKIKSARGVKQAKELIDIIMREE